MAFTVLTRKRKIKPDNTYLSIVCQQLPDLIFYILSVFAHIPSFIQSYIGCIRCLTLWMITVNCIIRMMPVNKRIVESNFQSFGSESFNIFFYQIFPVRSVWRFIVGKFRVEQTETLMMFCSEDNILHSCSFSHFCPFMRLSLIHIKHFKILLILFVCHSFSILHPFVAGG